MVQTLLTKRHGLCWPCNGHSCQFICIVRITHKSSGLLPQMAFRGYRITVAKSKPVNRMVLFLKKARFSHSLKFFVDRINSFPGGSDSKESAYYVEYPVSVPGSRRSPGEGNDNPLQYSCLENPMDRGAWRATVYGVTKSWTCPSD